MAQTIKLSPNVILLISDEVDSVDLNATNLYLYQYSGGRQQLLFEDGEFEERTNSFGYFVTPQGGYNKVLLSPTPNFYPDTHEAPNFHNDAELSNILTAPLSSNLDFIKCKLMFASGFSYDPQDNALQYLSIQYRGSNGIVDLINFYDDYSLPDVTAADREIVLDGTIYNSQIEFRLLSIARLQSLTAADAVELNTTLFGTDTPEVLHVEYSVLPATGLVPFVEATITFDKLVPEIINSNSFSVSFENNDIDVNLTQDNGEVTFQMIHTRYNLENYLQARGINTDTIRYDITLTQYDVGNSVVGTISQELKNNLNKFGTITYHPTNLNAAVDYIDVSVTATLTTLDGASIVKTTNIIISDVTPLLGVNFDVDMEVYNLTNNITQEIQTVQNSFDAPTIVEVERPVYLQKFSTSKITLYPVKMVVDVVGVYNDTLVNQSEFAREFTPTNANDGSTSTVNNPAKDTVPTFTYLQIGTKQYRNIEGSIFRYEIDEYAHAENAKSYLIVDDKGYLITNGEIDNAKI